jgi:uncharacterized protein (TIGR03086 family)
MTDSPDPDLVALARLHAHLEDVLAGASGVDVGAPTPCEDWTLRDLLDHVTGGNRFTSAILRGDSAADAMTKTIASFADPDGGNHQSAMGDMVAAFNTSGALEREYDHVAGTLDGRNVLRLRLHDLIIHAWDIGQTLDPKPELPTDLVAWGLAELDTARSPARQHFGAGSAGTGPSLQDRYLGHFGRSPAR